VGAPHRERRNRLQPGWSNSGAHRARFEQLHDLFRGRSVLDLGCASGWRRTDWFHGLIRAEAAEVVGVDIDEQAVAEIRASGVENVEVGDATGVELSRTFDVVHAGELIEHVDNPGALLATAARHMHEGSLLVVTTPNAFCVSNFVYRLGRTARVNEQHVAWYCEDTLRQLLERNGFHDIEISFLEHRSPARWRSVVGGATRALLPRRLAWNTLLATARTA